MLEAIAERLSWSTSVMVVWTSTPPLSPSRWLLVKMTDRFPRTHRMFSNPNKVMSNRTELPFFQM
jgi:hypothetical protein